MKFVDKSLLRRIPLLVLLSLTTGCQIIPGLRLRQPPESPEGRSYQLESAGDGEIKATGPGERAYRVVAVNAEVVAALASSDDTPLPLRVTSPVLPPLSEYTIGPGDNLSITVFDAPQLSNTGSSGTATAPVTIGAAPAPAAPVSYTTASNNSGALVAVDGTIFVPYAGMVKVAGLTAHEADQVIARELGGVMKNPQVDVRVSGFRSRRVVVGGQVMTPGTDTLNDLPETLLDVIHDRGGLKPNASQRRFYLTRDGTTYEIPLTQRRARNYGALAQALPGDFIFVPDIEDDQVFVLGEVGKVSPLPMAQGHMSLTEALTAVGGLSSLTAKESGLMIFRRPRDADADRRPVVYTIDLSHPVGVLLAGEFSLQPRDVVYVQSTTFADYNLVINQLLPTITSLFEAERFTQDLKH